MYVKFALFLLVAACMFAGCASAGMGPGVPGPAGGVSPTPGPTVSGMVALSDLGTSNYLGFQGGLYPGGSDTPPPAHDSAGKTHAGLIQPLDANGNPSASGKIVLMSIGMSNTTDEWCDGPTGMGSCMPWTFTGLALATTGLNTKLVIANGALPGQDAKMWLDPVLTDCLPSNPPWCNNFNRVATQVLPALGVTEKQVQAIWLKQADENPTVSLPTSSADAFTLEKHLGEIIRAAKVRYPNLQVVLLSSRIYGGYATTPLNPEPYAYESGFAVKWVIQAQINQMAGGAPDPVAGDLNYSNGTAPWIGWAAYLWANGLTARSDGVVWCNGQPGPPCNTEQDYQSDGTHPSSPAGQQKVGNMLLTVFKNSPYTSGWFL